MSQKKTQNTELKSIPLKERISFRLQKIGTMLTVQAGSILKSSGNLTLNQWRLLSFLNEREEGTLSDMIRFGVVDKATISRAARELTKHGLIEASVSAQDRRISNLRLTALGKDQLSKTTPAMEQHQRELMNALTDDERKMLFHILDKLEHTIGETPEKRPKIAFKVKSISRFSRKLQRHRKGLE